MGCQTKKTTNLQLSEKVKNYNFPGNSLGLTMSYKYLSNILRLNWSDLAFAIENKYLPHEAAIEHAMWELEKDDYHKRTMDLACLDNTEFKQRHSIHPYIDELARLESEEDKSKSKDRIMYAVLRWVFEHRDKYEDPLHVVTFIYSDFGYPKLISHFITFMPESDVNDKRCLLSRWEDFLNEQNSKYLEDSLEGNK